MSAFGAIVSKSAIGDKHESQRSATYVNVSERRALQEGKETSRSVEEAHKFITEAMKRNGFRFPMSLEVWFWDVLCTNPAGESKAVPSLPSR
jgi:hypothetical protein